MSLELQPIRIMRKGGGTKVGTGTSGVVVKDIPGSPFNGYYFRVANTTVNQLQKPDGKAEVDPYDRVSFHLSDNGGTLPTFLENDQVVLASGQTFLVGRVRDQYDDRVQLDVRRGLLGPTPPTAPGASSLTKVTL